MNQQAVKKSSAMVVLIAWLWVGIPLAWGVIQTLHKAADLFQ